MKRGAMGHSKIQLAITLAAALLAVGAATEARAQSVDAVVVAEKIRIRKVLPDKWKYAIPREGTLDAEAPYGTVADSPKRGEILEKEEFEVHQPVAVDPTVEIPVDDEDAHPTMRPDEMPTIDRGGGFGRVTPSGKVAPDEAPAVNVAGLAPVGGEAPAATEVGFNAMSGSGCSLQTSAVGDRFFWTAAASLLLVLAKFLPAGRKNNQYVA